MINRREPNSINPTLAEVGYIYALAIFEGVLRIQ